MGGKKGFTLVEMIVVMAIIAVLTLMSVGALASVRTQYYLDSVVEDVVTTVREAQNNSISIVDGKYPGTKAWGVKVSGGSQNDSDPHRVSLVSYYYQSGKLEFSEERVLPTDGVRFEFINQYGSYAKGNVYVSFTAPFASPYIVGISTNIVYGCTNEAASEKDYCKWQKGTKPTQEWEIIPMRPDNSYFITAQQGGQVWIDITYKNSKRRIWIKSNGDAYIER